MAALGSAHRSSAWEGGLGIQFATNVKSHPPHLLSGFALSGGAEVGAGHGPEVGRGATGIRTHLRPVAHCDSAAAVQSSSVCPELSIRSSVARTLGSGGPDPSASRHEPLQRHSSFSISAPPGPPSHADEEGTSATTWAGAAPVEGVEPRPKGSLSQCQSAPPIGPGPWSTSVVARGHGVRRPSPAGPVSDCAV